jgi:predicted glycoside hydrolase/deacetylase ChbG (UPF0249 family)
MAEMAQARTIGVCADDFGLGTEIGSAILELAWAQRLTAVSCLVNGPAWRKQAHLLLPLPRTLQRGLHFNLTEGRPLSAALRTVWPVLPPLPRLLRDAMLHRLPLAAIGAEWRAQWQALVDATGRTPDFVDGHQHVHHLPGVREIVLAGVAASDAPVAVRCTGRVAGPGSAVKRYLIEATGGWALQRQLERRGVPHNAVLLGAYDFRDTDYRSLMRRWLRAAPQHGALLFCHPGAGRPVGDPIAAAREREAAYLASEAFPADLAEAGVSLGPAWGGRSSGG